MKFIIKACDDLGHELSSHETYAEPHFSPVNNMVYFEFKSHYFAITKDLYDAMMERTKREPEPLPYNHPHCSEDGYKHLACTYPVCDMSCPVQQAKMKNKLEQIGVGVERGKKNETD